MLLAVFLFAALAVFFFIRLHLTKIKQEKTLNHLEEILQQVVYNRFSEDQMLYHEGHESKLIFTAKKIVQLNQDYQFQAKAEHQQTQELIADISHQMRTPLAGIMMYTELLKAEGISSSEREEFLHRIENSSEKLLWLGSELINLSRFETKTIQLQPAEGKLQETIRQALNSFTDMAVKKNITIDNQLSQEIQLFYDKKWTEEAIKNILDNALKYAYPDSLLTIKAERLIFYTRIQICNIGPTIPAEEISSVFQKYFRGSQTKDAEGAGIGLYLAKLIFEEQNGYITAESFNHQTIFSLFLLN